MVERSKCLTLLVIISTLLLSTYSYPQSGETFNRAYCDIRKTGIRTFQGFTVRAFLNSSGFVGGPYTCGLDAYDPLDDPNVFVYPLVDSLRMHMWGAGPWFGAKVQGINGTFHAVTTSYAVFVDRGFYDICETMRDSTKGDSLWRTSILQTLVPNRRLFDDDGDGKIDEDELDGTDNDGDWVLIRDDLNHNGRPDHGEPNVDEDYSAVSENDIYMACRDSFSEPRVPQHFPLSIKIWQKSYAWKERVKEPMVIMEYYFINEWIRDLDSVYLGFFVDQYMHPIGHSNQLSYLLPDVRTVIGQNTERLSVTPFGITLLGTSKPLDQLKFTFKRYPSYNTWPANDEERYQHMSTGNTVNSTEPTQLSQFLISVGPFDRMQWGDTVKLAIALVAGTHVDNGPDNIRSNAAKALLLYSRNYAPPIVPPSPPFKIIPGDRKITLDWTWYPGYRSSNPLETWDDSNKIVGALPETSWRRRDPPPGKSAGGRVFEGFNVWRSEYPTFSENQFTILHQFDIADELNLNGQTGIQFTFTDSTVLRGKRYWYAVTSFSVPDYFFSYLYDTLRGIMYVDTILTDPIESAIHENAVTVPIPFAPSNEVGKVKVVPNPYRTDQDYTYEGGGWEGLGRIWNEEKRLVWFIHLPPKCTIRVFTIAGEIIKVLEHDDEYRKSSGLAEGQEEFILLSESNRALASGIYVYLVESPFGTQTGKFVVIR